MSVSTSRGSEPAKTHSARALGQVQELVDEQLDLVRRDLRPALVDLGLLAGRRVDHRRVGARLLADADEVREHAELRELVDDAGAGRAAGQAGGDHRRAERLEHAGDVDALAAGHRRLLHRAVAAAEPEVGHRQGLVDGRVERDGDDHAALAWRRRRRPVWARRRASRTVATSAAIATPIRIQRAARGRLRLLRDARRGDGALGDQRRPSRRACPPWRTSTRPSRWPLRIGPSTTAGAWTSTLHRVAMAALDDPAHRPVGHQLQLARRAVADLAPSPSRVPSTTARMRWKRGIAQLKSAIVSLSRAASLGVPSTALMSWMPLRLAEPTST